MEYLANIDLFQAAPALYVKAKDKIGSNPGKIFTLITVGIWLALFFTFGWDMIHHKNPSFYQYTKQRAINEQNPAYTTAGEFPLIFKIGPRDNNGVTDPRLNDINKQLSYLFPVATSREGKNLKIGRCPYEGYSKYWCILDDESLAIDTTNGVSIKFYPCNKVNPPSLLGNTVCESDADINQVLQYSYVEVGFTTYSVDPTIYKTPFIRTLNTDIENHMIFPGSSPLSHSFAFTPTEFTSDNGFLFSKEEKTTVLNSHSEVNGASASIGYWLINFILISGQDKIIYHRKYDKLPDVLAQVNGIIGIVIIVFTFLNMSFAEEKMYEQVGNNLYRIRIKKTSKTMPKKHKQTNRLSPSLDSHTIELPSAESKSYAKINSSKPSSSQSPILPSALEVPQRMSARNKTNKASQSSPDSVSKHQQYEGNLGAKNQNDSASPLYQKGGRYDSEFSQIVIPEDQSPNRRPAEKLSSNYFQWLTRRPKPRTRALARVKEEVTRQIDILSIIRRAKELDYLKLCLLSDKQRALFNRIPKQILTIYDDEDEEKKAVAAISEDNKVDQDDKVEEGAGEEAYNALNNEPNKSEIDDQILSLYRRVKDLGNV